LTAAAGRERDGGMAMSPRLLALFFVLSASASQARAQLQPQAASASQVAQPAALSPEQAAHRALVVVKFGAAGQTPGQVTVGELEDAILEQNPFMQTRYLTPDAVRALLDRNVRFALLAAEAERRGYAKNRAVQLAVEQNAVQTYIQREFDDKLTPDSVPAEAVKQYYDGHIDEFVRGENRRASALFVATEAQANSLLPQVKSADLRTFRELARTKSVDATTRQRGGDLRYFDATGRSEDSEPPIDAQLARAVFALKHVGDTTGVIKVAATFVIAKLTGQRAATEESLKQADGRVRMRLWRERRQAAIDAKLAELRTQLHVVVHPELVAVVQVENTAAPMPPDQGLPNDFPQARPGPILSPPSP
jgi:peptidyl-prolyl cis-trans isomerase C